MLALQAYNWHMSKHDEANFPNNFQSQGGKARADKLLPEKRREIATAAASARWNTPKASHGGTIKIGNWSNCQCYNLEIDGEVKRLISQRSFMEIVGIEGGVKRCAFVSAHLLDNPFIPPKKVADLRRAIENPLKFLTNENIIVYGYEGRLIVEYCKALMEARRINALPEYALGYAEACEKVVLALAGVGIAALIDEATGYEKIRERKTLEALLDKYLKHEFSSWAKRFPDEFYQELFRLRGWEWKGMKVNRPQCVGTDTKDLIYSRLEVGILKELELRNPWNNEIKRRGGYHHCLLTEDLGQPALAQHLHTIITIMRGFPSKGWKRFKEFIDLTLPRKGDSVQFMLNFED